MFLQSLVGVLRNLRRQVSADERFHGHLPQSSNYPHTPHLSVLDKQLQETKSQFEHKAGVVQVISENSAQLVKALNARVRDGFAHRMSGLQGLSCFVGVCWP
jgi:hypothetical protein